MHPNEVKLAGFLDKTLPAEERAGIERHIASCPECLKALVSAHETVAQFKVNLRKKTRFDVLKKINPYLVLAVACFFLSFLTPKFFIQSLVATLLFGVKWVADSKSTKMLVMIYDAWKRGGDKEASNVLNYLEREKPGGLDRIFRGKSKIL
jgi:hypothetical protein